MKRWLIAGLDDTDWDLNVGVETHIGADKVHFLADVARGFSEEECDRLAHSFPPA